MGEPLVSVIVPCFNAEKWLAPSLESALGQTWPNLEVIVIDDGSTDRSREVALSLRSPKLRLIDQARGGAPGARNRGLAEAKGDYVQYLDADDLLAAHKIERQVRLLEDRGRHCVAVGSTKHFFDGSDPESGILDDFGPALGDSDDPVNWLLRLHGLGGIRGGMVQTSAWLIPSSLAAAAGPWNAAAVPDDDGEYFNRVLLAGAGIRVDPTVGVFYRKHRSGQNLSYARDEGRRLGQLTAMELKSARLLARTSDGAARGVFARHFIEIAMLCYPEHPQLSARALVQWRDLGAGFEDTVPFNRLEWVRRLCGWRTACRVRALKQKLFHVFGR